MNTITKTTEITIDSKPIRTKNAKPVYCISDGSIYASGLDAANALNVDAASISTMCRGKVKSVKGKQYCFVSDLHNHILDISNITKELLEDAMKYREIEAKRIAEEQRVQKKNKLQNEIEAIKKRIADEQRRLENAECEYAMM